MDNARQIKNALLAIIAHAKAAVEATMNEDDFELDSHVTDLEGEIESLAKLVRGPQRATNVDIVTGIMNYSRHGALAQAFVIDALTKWSAKIASVDPKECDTPMLNGAAWVGVAKEIKEKLDAAYSAKR